MRNKYIVIGAGKLGSYIANSLSLQGNDVIVVDSDKTRVDYLPITYSGLTVVGDATLLDTLENAHIDTCKCLMCFTRDDNTNILISHLAKVFYEVPSIIIRLNDPNKNVLVDQLGIKTISPFFMSINEIDKIIKGMK
jgi:trk system potassium uptake protein TrkA